MKSLKSCDFEFEIEEEDRLVYVYITSVDWGTPGYISGAPEDCYPSEGAEVSWYALNENGTNADLSDSQIEQIDEVALEFVEEEARRESRDY